MREKYLSMKKLEKDYEYLETSSEMLLRGLRRISRPKFLDNIKGKSLKNCKSRITIFIDADIIDHFKQQAEQNGKGYQTLINQTLRDSIEVEKPQHLSVKEDLLKDKQFLENLKTALAI
jgi:uncharacterized protein (DUF4415 family)